MSRNGRYRDHEGEWVPAKRSDVIGIGLMVALGVVVWVLAIYLLVEGNWPWA